MRRSVHPRVCGEHLTLRQKYEWVGGSSPRVWGTRDPQTVCQRPWRFIPACVGNTLRAVYRVQDYAVHPRVCGEHADEEVFGYQERGSSPRVWGTLPTYGVPGLVDRFIPACVGNTPVSGSIRR